MFKQTFTLNPVGQGFFYTGEISLGSHLNTFNFVFDCGSINKINCLDEVCYHRNLSLKNSKEIDLLIISHFDSDHINCIGELLRDDTKVKKLVMPFVSFEERLFLVLRHLSQSRNTKHPADDFMIRFTLDPLGTIYDNLDEDSEIYIIEGGPVSPSGPSEESPQKNSEELLILEDGKFSFTFTASESLGSDDIEQLLLGQCSKGSISKVYDNNLGVLDYSNVSIHIMEFIFYKRSLGNNENDFYKRIREKFFEKYEIEDCTDQNELLQNVINKIKTITSGSSIREKIVLILLITF